MSTASRITIGFTSLPLGQRFASALVHIGTWMPGLLTVSALLVLWELASRAGWIDHNNFPAMSETVAELYRLTTTAPFWWAVWDTLRGWAMGLLIATVLGVPIGIVVGSSELLYRALRVPIEFLRPIPSVSLVPVALLIFGVGHESKVFLAAFAAFWPLFVQTLYGVKDADPVALDTARSYGLNAAERMLFVKLPFAFPYIATGLRISSAVSLILAVTAEVVIGSPGLGKEINVARSSADNAGMYAFIVTIGLLGWFLNVLAVWVERRVLHWHASQRSEVK